MKSVFITGGLGYLGGRLALAIVARWPQARVFLGIRSGRARPDWAAGFELREMDLGAGPMPGVIPDGVETLIHLAALNEIESQHDPEAALRVNTLGTYHLLGAALEAGVKQAIYFSTFHVYGPRPSGRITEDTVTRSSHPYAFTHRAAEDVVAFFRDCKGLPGLVLRLSNAFGAPADLGVNRWSLVFNDLCRQAVDAERLTLKSSGVQHRDFIPLSDVAAAVLHFVAQPGSWGDGLFNLGSGRSMSILEAAGHVARVFAQTFDRLPPPVVAPEPRPGEIPTPFVFAVDKLLESGFSPGFGMDSEIRNCLLLCAEGRDARHARSNGREAS